MKKSMQNIFVLVCICAVVSVILAVTNAITAPAIEANEKAKAVKALLEVMPDGVSFEPIDLDGQKMPSTVKEAYLAENGGYVFKLMTTGYAPGMVIMCGVRTDGTVSGSKLIASSETPSIGGAAAIGLAGLTVGKKASDIETVNTVSGATKTTAAYRSALKDALNAALILSGEDVDIRTEEEILRDNLAAALPSSDGEFEKVFLTEALVGVDAVYRAKNQSGFVCVIGKQFVGASPDGTILSATSEELGSTAANALGILLASESHTLTLSDYEGLPALLTSAERTASGNYILEIKGAGYGINGGSQYHPASGKYIVIRVSLTPEGKILDCLTVSQEETEGIGSACADRGFYEQFVGKTEETYLEADAISGATLTTNGYRQAILNAFESVKILEKGATS